MDVPTTRPPATTNAQITLTNFFRMNVCVVWGRGRYSSPKAEVWPSPLSAPPSPLITRQHPARMLILPARRSLGAGGSERSESKGHSSLHFYFQQLTYSIFHNPCVLSRFRTPARSKNLNSCIFNGLRTPSGGGRGALNPCAMMPAAPPHNRQ